MNMSVIDYRRKGCSGSCDLEHTPFGGNPSHSFNFGNMW